MSKYYHLKTKESYLYLLCLWLARRGYTADYVDINTVNYVKFTLLMIYCKIYLIAENYLLRLRSIKHNFLNGFVASPCKLENEIYRLDLENFYGNRLKMLVSKSNDYLKQVLHRCCTRRLPVHASTLK